MANDKSTKKKKKPLVYPVIFMIAISALFTGALATLNAVTAERIDIQEAVKNQRSVLFVFDQEVPEDIDAVQEAFHGLVEEKTINDISYYAASKDGDVIGYAFPFQGSGLWGTIWGYVAVSPDFSQIIGVDFIKHSETPGLGGRISEDWYRNQFRGIDISENMDEAIIYRPAEGGNADTITGATLTSLAVKNMINNELDHLLSEVKGEL